MSRARPKKASATAPPGQPRSPDAWERAKTISVVVAGVFVPIAVAVVGGLYAFAVKDRDLQIEHIKIAVSILREPPNSEGPGLREWATEVLNRNSDVPMPTKARKELLEATQLPGGLVSGRGFSPHRLIAFGDELSLLLPDGRKYAPNALAPDGSIVCSRGPIWVQALAANFGLAFSECNAGGLGTPKAYMRATLGASVADLRTQIKMQMALKSEDGGIKSLDLVTVLVGANDVLSLYSDFPGRSEEELVSEVQARGQLLASQVNLLVSLGAKVIISTIPDMGLTPFALRQRAEFGDTDRAALLSRLTSAFNAKLQTNIVLDGRYVGLVLADEMIQAQIKVPSAFGLENTTTAVCASALPMCNDRTLAPGSSALTWLWSDEWRLSSAGQTRLGQLAIARAINNPF